jgi:hypothetical protein
MGEFIKKVLNNTKENLTETLEMQKEERERIIKRLNNINVGIMETEYNLKQVKKELENR